MDICIIPVPKAKLDKIPEIERAFYIHIGHLRNELGVLVKFLNWSINDPSDNPVLVDLNVSQSLIISRMLAGKLWEGWILLDKAYTAPKLDQSIESKLSKETKDALYELRKYFGQKNNVINIIRNKFAFHYDPEKVRNQLSLVDETDKLEIYVPEKRVNLFYMLSEIIVNSGMLEAVESGDYIAATKKLAKEVIEKSLLFIAFCDGCLQFMTENYLGKTRKELGARKAIIPDPPSRKDIQLPFFTK